MLDNFATANLDNLGSVLDRIEVGPSTCSTLRPVRETSATLRRTSPKAERLLGYRPVVELEPGLRDTLAALQRETVRAGH